MAKSNQEREKLRLRYVRFEYEVREIDRLRNQSFYDFGVTIAFLLGKNFIKYIGV